MASITYRENVQFFRSNESWLILLDSGNATITPPGRMRQSRAVRAPACIIIPEGRKSQVEIRGANHSIAIPEYNWKEIRESLGDSGIHIQPKAIGLELTKDDKSFLTSLFHQADIELQTSSLHIHQFLESLCRNILIFFYRRRVSNPEDRLLWTIEDAMTYIEMHVCEQFTLEFFSRKCAMNTATFSREFKLASNFTLFEYINRVKIRHACTMLKNESMTILDIAIALGYNNVSFFNRYFRKVIGRTPSEFRKLK